MLLKQEGKHLEIFGKPSNFSKRIIQDYTIAERIDTISYATLKNNYLIAHKKLYIMDSLAIYPPVIQLDYLVLTQSPKLNLERLLDSIQPKKLIVDGSNYKSYIANWEATCIKRKLPFHYTGEKGAYYFK